MSVLWGPLGIAHMHRGQESCCALIQSQSICLPPAEASAATCTKSLEAQQVG